MTDAHEEKETLTIDVLIPEHADRVTTPLFSHTRDKLLEKVGGRCWVCQRTADEAGPIEAHHHPVERSLAGMIDFGPGSLIRQDFPQFDWAAFDAAGGDPYLFVDDMTINGLALCRDHHTRADSGIHTMPFPFVLAERYGREGYQFTTSEIIHHDQ